MSATRDGADEALHEADLDRHDRQVSQHFVREAGQDHQQSVCHLPAQLVGLAARRFAVQPAAVVVPPRVGSVFRPDLGRTAEQLLASRSLPAHVME